MKGKAVAQYDVHLNPGPMQASVPMVVLVQSSLFDNYRRRVVVPLVLRAALPAGTKVAGTRMDWRESDAVSEFVFENPNAKGVCGCGESFNT